MQHAAELKSFRFLVSQCLGECVSSAPSANRSCDQLTFCSARWRADLGVCLDGFPRADTGETQATTGRQRLSSSSFCSRDRHSTVHARPPAIDRPTVHGAMALAAAMAAVEELGMSDAGAEFDEVGARWSDQVLRCTLRALRHTNTHFSACTTTACSFEGAIELHAHSLHCTAQARARTETQLVPVA
jgi:hypothetical protein